MTTLTFKSKEFPRMLEFMRNNERKIPYGEFTKDFGLHLVKDDGIYLMAGTFESDKLDEKGVTSSTLKVIHLRQKTFGKSVVKLLAVTTSRSGYLSTKQW